MEEIKNLIVENLSGNEQESPFFEPLIVAIAKRENVALYLTPQEAFEAWQEPALKTEYAALAILDATAEERNVTWEIKINRQQRTLTIHGGAEGWFHYTMPLQDNGKPQYAQLNGVDKSIGARVQPLIRTIWEYTQKTYKDSDVNEVTFTKEPIQERVFPMVTQKKIPGSIWDGVVTFSDLEVAFEMDVLKEKLQFLYDEAISKYGDDELALANILVNHTESSEVRRAHKSEFRNRTGRDNRSEPSLREIANTSLDLLASNTSIYEVLDQRNISYTEYPSMAEGLHVFAPHLLDVQSGVEEIRKDIDEVLHVDSVRGLRALLGNLLPEKREKESANEEAVEARLKLRAKVVDTMVQDIPVELQDVYRQAIDKGTGIPHEALDAIMTHFPKDAYEDFCHRWSRSLFAYFEVMGNSTNHDKDSKTQEDTVVTILNRLAHADKDQQIPISFYYALINSGNALRVGYNQFMDVSEIKMLYTTSVLVKTLQELGYNAKGIVVNEATEAAPLLGMSDQVVQDNVQLAQQYLEAIGMSSDVEIRSMRADIRDILGDDFDQIHEEAQAKMIRSADNNHRAIAFAKTFPLSTIAEIVGGRQDDVIQAVTGIAQATALKNADDIPQSVLDVGWERARQFDSIMGLRSKVATYAQKNNLAIPPEFNPDGIEVTITRKHNKPVLEFWGTFEGERVFPTHGIGVVQNGRSLGNIQFWEVLAYPEAFKVHLSDGRIIAVEYVSDDMVYRQALAKKMTA